MVTLKVSLHKIRALSIPHKVLETELMERMDTVRTVGIIAMDHHEDTMAIDVVEAFQTEADAVEVTRIGIVRYSPR